MKPKMRLVRENHAVGPFETVVRGAGLLEEINFPEDFFKFVMTDSVAPRAVVINTHAGIRAALKGLIDYKDKWPKEFDELHDVLKAHLKSCEFREGTIGGATFRCFNDGSMNIPFAEPLKLGSWAYKCGKTEIERMTKSAVRKARRSGRAPSEEILVLADHYQLPRE